MDKNIEREREREREREKKLYRFLPQIALPRRVH